MGSIERERPGSFLALLSRVGIDVDLAHIPVFALLYNQAA
jgi:hypothetical protein